MYQTQMGDCFQDLQPATVSFNTVCDDDARGEDRYREGGREVQWIRLEEVVEAVGILRHESHRNIGNRFPDPVCPFIYAMSCS